MDMVFQGECGEFQVDDLDKALIGSCWHGNFHCCQRLLKEGANVNAQDIDGNTPLILAATNDHCSKYFITGLSSLRYESK